jgi:uncharacterized membrane protein YebE (DUF533 family)
MFNAEKLLGQVLGGVLGQGGKKKKKSSLLGELTSGAGLMTAIGLAVGAYEVLKDKKTGQAPHQGYSTGPAMPPPPPWGQTTANMPPAVPPPPPGNFAAPVPPAAIVSAPGDLGSEELARRMIQVMIAAACADGAMDEQEEKAILDKLRETELSQEEKMFMLEELHHPKDIAALTEGITQPSVAKVMYMLAVSAVAVDTDTERTWLDEFARSLGISPAVQKFIEEQQADV